MDEHISVVLWILLRGYVVNKEVADFTFLTLRLYAYLSSTLFW